MPRRPGERHAGIGEILELPEQRPLLTMDRVRPADRDSWGPAPFLEGQIVEDMLDGTLFFPEPPRRDRTVHRVDRLLDRATPAVWPFALLACAQVGPALADWRSPDVALRLGYAVAACLLPAAILLWRPDVVRSAGLVLAGAIAWTTLPAVAGLVAWALRPSPVAGGPVADSWAAVAALAAAGACLGPAVMAIGLERIRRRRMISLFELARWAAVLTALVALMSFSRWAPSPGDAPVSPAAGVLDPLAVTGWVGGAMLPLQLMCLLILAGSCLSAVAEGEPQSRLWQCAAAGAALLACASAYDLSGGGLPAGAMAVAGMAIAVLAFASPVWSAAADADGLRPGAPDEVFYWGDDAVAAGIEPLPMSAIVAVAAGADHALVLDERGHVGAWGDDWAGQADIPPGLSDAVAIAAGNGFSLALRSDGTVAAWGANELGQTDVPSDLGGVIAIAAGGAFALALKDDGTIVGWGDGSHAATHAPRGLSGVACISAGDNHGLALCRDGTVVAWGDNSRGQSDVPRRLGRVAAVSAGGDFSLALLADGTVAGWGDDSYGQIEIPPGLDHVTAVAAGAFHALALRAGGDVVGWGGGGRKLGEASHPWRLVDFKAVAAGDRFSLAIRAA